jgi:Protein of unknown function (DUF2891)
VINSDLPLTKKKQKLATMKKFLTSIFVLTVLVSFAQPAKKGKESTLTNTSPDGTLLLSDAGASYFAKLSLDCTGKPYPHYYYETLEKAEDLKAPDKQFPSFYGCFDWHSGVHNHWALVKLLKNYPKIAEAKAIKDKLEMSFDAKNILVEIEYLKKHEEQSFEFPYGRSWLLKVADELARWNDPLAKKWLKNLMPLCDYIVADYMIVWPRIPKATYTGDHYASSLGISFALDYAITMKNDSLKNVLLEAANGFYSGVKKFPLVKEPFGYDFMSAGLLITDLMRKVLPQKEYVDWLKAFSPDMFTTDGVKKVFAVEKKETHTGYASHWDGFHLNRIWCINGMLQSIPTNTLSPEVKKAWQASQKEMWDYAQTSIGKGNYDVDHWLSSFSVYALTGTK